MTGLHRALETGSQRLEHRSAVPFLRWLLARGVRVTLNSDHPAYFGGYLTENYVEVARALRLSRADLHTLARNAFEAAFLDRAARARHLAELDAYVARAD